jgi:5'-3' exonuclease
VTSPRLMLLDTASLYFRAFYGVPDTVTAPDGTPVNAVRGLLDFISRLVGEYRPTHLVCCWDNDWRPQWRVDLIPSYKAHRVEYVVATGPDVEVVPDPLEAQVPIIQEVLAAFGIAVVGADGYEADDVIGTIAAHSTMPTDVVTGDRDLFQVVDDAREVRVLYVARGVAKHERVTNDVIRSKYGVTAAQYADFAALRGDTSDGLPGVPGVGEKTAAGLLSKFPDMDALLAAAADPSSELAPGPRRKLKEAAAYLAVAPAVCKVATDLDLPPAATYVLPPTPVDHDGLVTLATRWGLDSPIARLVETITTTR